MLGVTPVPIPKLVPLNTKLALSLNNPLAPAYITRPLVNAVSLILAAVRNEPSHVRFALPVRIFEAFKN